MSKKNNKHDSAPDGSTPPVPVKETPAQMLSRLAKARVPRAVAAVRSLANLASYKPSPEQTERIMATMRTELDALETALRSGRKTTVAFEL